MKIYFLLTAAIITIGTACKKDTAEKPACRISKAIAPSGEVIKINYDDAGRAVKIENAQSGETIIADYSSGSNVYTIVNSVTGTSLSKLTTELNNSGMVSLLKRELYDPSGSLNSLQTTKYEYNGTELVKTARTVSGRSTATYETFSWTNGNMTSSHNDGYDTFYEYFSDKPVQQGDWFSFMNLIGLGFDLTKMIANKNLIQNYAGIVIDYDFDTEGKIIAIYQNALLIYTIQYECR